MADAAKYPRTLVAYLVTGWIVLQVADIVLEPLGAPEWVMVALIAVLTVGLFVVAIVEWRRAELPDWLKGRGVDYFVIVMLVIALGLTIYVYESDQTEIRSIAVLPFADLSREQDLAYLGSGLAEELLNSLVSIDGLVVASRTDSFILAGRGATTSEISEQLGVDSILEGSVRREGGLLRVTVQLIEAGSGYHLWSRQFDQPEQQLLSLQTSVAEAVAVGVAENRGPDEEVMQVFDVGTKNSEAYQAYLQAQHLGRLGNPASWFEQIRLYQRAIALDPSFWRAQSWLALQFYYAGQWALTRQQLAKIEELDPNGERSTVKFDTYVRGLIDYDFPAQAAALNTLIEQYVAGTYQYWGGASDPTAQYATILGTYGLNEDARGFLLTTALKDPSDPYIHTQLAFTENILGNNTAAIEHANRCIENGPARDYCHSVAVRALVDLGREEEARAEARKIPEQSHWGIVASATLNDPLPLEAAEDDSGVPSAMKAIASWRLERWEKGIAHLSRAFTSGETSWHNTLALSEAFRRMEIRERESFRNLLSAQNIAPFSWGRELCAIAEPAAADLSIELQCAQSVGDYSASISTAETSSMPSSSPDSLR